MTRPKVPVDQRQRTQQACTSCKRRKQKCNGLSPCHTCERRKFECIYDDRADIDGLHDGHPAKKQRVSGNVSESQVGDASDHQVQPTNYASPNSARSAIAIPTANKLTAPNAKRVEPKTSTSRPYQSNVRAGNGSYESVEKAARSLQQFSTPQHETVNYNSRDLTRTPQPGHGVEEEAYVYSQTRVLQDPTGRLLYVGDSATLSFLQLIRIIVETVSGPSPFTMDPSRHKIMEAQLVVPPNTRNSLLIPHKITGALLVESFFTNTHGLIHIFDYKSFFAIFDAVYADPLSAEPNWLCLLNLVFAIGLTMANPPPGTPEADIIEKLRHEPLDRAELFYHNAKSLNDPMTGLEDADFWSIQALILMTVFMLARSKRNTSFALLGMAIRSAYALGLHRAETLVIFTLEEQSLRCNVWRTLFILDRFLSCSLGRPPGISEDECSSDVLLAPDVTTSLDESRTGQPSMSAPQAAHKNIYGIEAAVRSCSVIGTILKKIYQQRRVSTKLAQDIVDICKDCQEKLHPQLHWRQAQNASASHGVAIMHIRLFHCHSILLVTRPFFLFILNDVLQKGQIQVPASLRSRRTYARMEKFGEACVMSSIHTVVVVQSAWEAGHLARRNPFVIYFLFAAALILMSNEYANLFPYGGMNSCISRAIDMIRYCSESDQQASRLLYILSTFRDVVEVQRAQRTRNEQSANQLPPFNIQANGNLYGNELPSANLANSQSINQSNVTLPPVAMTNPLNFCLSQVPPISSPRYSALPAMATMVQPGTSPMGTVPNLSTPPSIPCFTSPAATRPLEPSLTSPAPPNPLSPHASGNHTPTMGSLDRTLSFSNLLDFTSINFDVQSLSEESTGQEDHIDFDALWAWGGTTPAVGSPKLPAFANGMVANMGDPGVMPGSLDALQGFNSSIIGRS